MKIVIGNVRDEIHIGGKLLFIKELNKNGFDVFDAGISVKTEEFVKKVKERNAKILVLTGLLSHAPKYMKEISKALQDNGLRREIKILIAGPNVDENWMQYTNADAFTNSVSQGVAILLKWRQEFP